MCKLSINNMLWLTLMSVVQNKDLTMLESRRYAVRLSQRLCSSCQELYHRFFFPFFEHFRFKKKHNFPVISKAIMDIFLQILDENWLDDT